MRRNKKLLTLRKRLGLTQAQFAEDVGIPESTYFNLERGVNSGIDKNKNWSVAALKIARFHGVPPEALFPRARAIIKRRMASEGTGCRELRLKRGLTQRELAAAIGVTLSNYIQLETGRTSPRSNRSVWKPMARKVAEYFGVAPDRLFRRTRRITRRRANHPPS